MGKAIPNITPPIRIDYIDERTGQRTHTMFNLIVVRKKRWWRKGLMRPFPLYNYQQLPRKEKDRVIDQAREHRYIVIEHRMDV